MRSVFVHLREVTEAELIEFLDRTYQKPKGEGGWTQVSSGSPVLYIDIYRDVNNEFEVEDWLTLLDCLGCEPAASVIADVSGRHPGDEEVRAFVHTLLSQFNGVAQDAYTDHCWTWDQIAKRETVQGHPFFDYQGWYDEEDAL